MTHPYPNRRFVPQAVLTRSGKINTAGGSVNTAGASVNTARTRINTTVRTVNTAGSKPTVNHPRSISNTSNTYKKGYSHVTRPFNTNTNSIFYKIVNIVRVKDTNAKYRTVVSKNKGKGANAVKASACWIQVYNGLDPQKSLILLFYVHGNPQQKEYKEKGVIDSGCSRHMTRNKCYLTEYEDYDGRFVSFGDGKEALLIRLCSSRRTKKEDGIFISQDKYVAEILKKFDFATVKTASTPMEPNKALVKDEEVDNVDVHLYRSMIGSLMYLTSSRPDIMFAVYACARFQVTPKTSHLHAGKRIFRYLKGQPKLGLWYPRDSPFDLKAFSDSDYAGASLDRKSTTRGCQFLGKRLISWQCKKQTIVANSTTEAEYVAAAHCCGQVLWIQNQMLDYGFNFMNTMIYIDNESTICIVKNPVFHSKTKHIEIRHHFIRDSYEKKLIQVIKIHTDYNVADLLTKAFDVSRNVFGSKTGSCTINAARQAKHIEYLVDDEAVHKELGDRMERAPTTASSLEAEHKKQSRRKQRKDTEVSQPSGPTEPMADETENMESVPTHSNDPLLSGEDSLKLNELMELCTNLQKKVLDLETTKTIQALEIDSLKRRVKKLEKKQKSKTHKLKRLYKVSQSAKVISSNDEASLGDHEDASKQGRKILDIDVDEHITLDSTHFDTDPDMFGVHDLHGDEVFVETQEPMVNAATTTSTIPVSAATATTTIVDELTLAQTLIEIKAAKPKVKGVMIQEPSETTTTKTTPAASKPSQDKGKAKND
ncbi:hypothetical protein Tco_1104132 [Tanacetum coccineum]